ncbi:MAG: hypothetical protein CFE21_10655 [Bacteroidetes bacterium B1(2017)]|nr:MAG: hypothetical protein CFE21_10655 [Bacteroidetes bacterium B1(2017)]
MKKATIVFLLFSFCFIAKAQLSSSAGPKIMLLANLRSDDAMWYEVGTMYLGKDFVNFQFKISSRTAYEYTDANSSIIGPYERGNNGYYYGKVNFNSSFTYIKAGYILLRKENKVSTFLLGINGVFGESKNKLQLDYYDPLLGLTSESFVDNRFHKGAEVEFTLLLDLNAHLAFSFGATLGKELMQEELFKDARGGTFSKRETYSPGMGFGPGGYFRISTGIVIKPY